MVNFRRGRTKLRMWRDMGWHTARNRQSHPADYTSPQRIFTPHTYRLVGLAGGHDPSGHSLTHSYSPRTRWRQWPHLIEQGTEGDITHGMQTHYRNGLTPNDVITNN